MLCAEEFDTEEQLDEHTQAAHDEWHCSCGEQFPSLALLNAHLLRHPAHQRSPEVSAYRQKVFAQVLHDWPTPITAQLHRTRLHAMKVLTTNANLGMTSCACCALEKPWCEVSTFTFPQGWDSEMPDWWEGQKEQS